MWKCEGFPGFRENRGESAATTAAGTAWWGRRSTNRRSSEHQEISHARNGFGAARQRPFQAVRWRRERKPARPRPDGPSITTGRSSRANDRTVANACRISSCLPPRCPSRSSLPRAGSPPKARADSSPVTAVRIRRPLNKVPPDTVRALRRHGSAPSKRLRRRLPSVRN